ncbi:MAG: hypothetical protein ACR2Q3_06635 [Woeseiaceae bacterium]
MRGLTGFVAGNHRQRTAPGNQDFANRRAAIFVNWSRVGIDANGQPQRAAWRGVRDIDFEGNVLQGNYGRRKL